MIGDEHCPKCDSPLKRTPTYDKATDTMHYRCADSKCTYVLVSETIANKKKSALKLTQRDVIRLRRGL